MVSNLDIASASSVADCEHVSGEFVIDNGCEVSPLYQATGQEQRARLRSVVRLLETAGQTLAGSDKQARRCIAKATALLRAECDPAPTSRDSSSRHDYMPAWKLTRVLSFIDANLDRPIKIGEVASVVHLSCSHFSRSFRATIGETPSALIIRSRIERAQQLILLTDKPLCEIALDCGLADQSHLTKLFRRSFGVTPGKWRRLQHGADIDVVDQKRICATSDDDTSQAANQFTISSTAGASIRLTCKRRSI